MTEIIVKGRNAKVKVLAALAAAYPGSVPGYTVDAPPTVADKRDNSEIKKMTHQEVLYDALEDQLNKLEHEIDGLLKAKKPNTTVDDWSDTDGGPLNLSGEDDDDDDTDYGDAEDDDEDDLDKIAKQTKFEAMTTKIANEENVPTAKAMTLARQRFPDLYAGFKDIKDVTKSYRGLVRAEIRKGNSEVVARQKVAAAYPELARETIAKSAASPAEFMTKCDQVMQARGCSRTQAMQVVRKQQPDLFRKFQNV